jgi:hypothetical protein
VVVDLLAPFRQQIGAQQLYFVVDGHWTPAGHAQAHRLLREKLAARRNEGRLK